MRSSANPSFQGQPATIAVIAFTYFWVVVAALYVLNPSYSLIRSFAGNYDLGSYKILIASTFFSLGLGSLALVIGLYRDDLIQPPHSRRALLFLGMWAVGMVLAGIFPANEPGSTVPHRTVVFLAGFFPVEVQATPETAFSFLHIFSILGSFWSLSLGALSLSRHFRQDEKWQSIYHPAFFLALLMLVSSILFFTKLFFPAFAGYDMFYELGLHYNEVTLIYIGTMIGILWLLLVAVRFQFIVIKRLRWPA